MRSQDKRWAKRGAEKGGLVIYNSLNPMKARSLSAGKYADGQGLWLMKRSKQAGKWIVRLSIAGKRREMGLGGWPDVSVAEARERAAGARRQVRDGLDPIQVRTAAKQKAKRLTVAEAIEGCFEARQAELKGDGKAGRWLSPLNIHIIPKIGSVAIEDVDQHTIRQVLEPIWNKKTQSAQKALTRMNITLKHAAALGLDVDLQATMKARALLGKQRHAVTHIPSLSYQEAPAFYRWLCTKNLQSCFALRFLMLTAARTSEVRYATKSDIVDGVLVIPPERTKTAIEHKIPLTEEALRVIEEAYEIHDGDLLFPSPRGKALSDAAMSRFMEREGYEARPHGFRGTFRTWAEEKTNASFEVKEACLGHAVDKGVVGAYQRSDRLAKRMELLEGWSGFLGGF